MAEVPIRNKDGVTVAQVIVDDIDHLWAKQFNWHLANDYAKRMYRKDGKRHNVFLHREIAARTGKYMLRRITFKNKNKLDCRRENLKRTWARNEL